MQNKKGFTLLELIVAMAIIAVLMGLSLFGIQSVQRSQRDTERRAALSNINLEIAAYYGDNGQYPPVAFDVQNQSAKIGPLTGTYKTVSLKGAAKLMVTTPATGKKSDQNGTYYCYINNGSSYSLGVYLEGNDGFGSSGTAQQLGNGPACGAQNIFP